MDKAAQIREQFKKLAGSDIKLVIGKVTEVDRDKQNCTVQCLATEDVYYNIRLNASMDDRQGIVFVPRQDSEVVFIPFGETGGGVIVSFGELDEIELSNKDCKVHLNGDEITFNGGELGGLVLAKELKKQLDKQTARIDAVIDAIKNGVPIAQDGGVGLQETISAALMLITNKEDYSSIENDKIVQ